VDIAVLDSAMLKEIDGLDDGDGGVDETVLVSVKDNVNDAEPSRVGVLV
jgi:hypothetical protein